MATPTLGTSKLSHKVHPHSALVISFAFTHSTHGRHPLDTVFFFFFFHSQEDATGEDSCTWFVYRVPAPNRGLTNLEKHLHAVDEKEDDHDEQQGGVTAVEEVGAAAGKQVRVRNLRQEQTVRQQVERQEAQKALGQKLGPLPADVAQVENLSEERKENKVRKLQYNNLFSSYFLKV